MRPALLLGLVVVAGCPLPYDDDDSASGGEAPRVESSFPGAAVQSLARGDTLEFTARGSDTDSLSLTWSFSLEGSFVAGGEVLDGTFDASWSMEFEEELAGQGVEVSFLVSDGALDAERSWSVQLDP